jgi:hypothetical protein
MKLEILRACLESLPKCRVRARGLQEALSFSGSCRPGPLIGALSKLVTAAPFLLSVFLFSGCARHYNITLNNNHVITTSSKPKLNKTGDAYVFKDQTGKMAAVPAGNVKLIEPRSHGESKPDPIFKPPRP